MGIEIIVQPAPPTSNGKGKIEAKLQSEIVRAYSVKYPNKRGTLFGTFQEVSSQVQGSQRLSLGLVAGVSDLLYVDEHGRLWGLEVKARGTIHKVSHLIKQAEWLSSIPYRGFFVDSVDMFWEVIETGEGGICPQRLLQKLKNIKGSSFLWDNIW